MAEVRRLPEAVQEHESVDVRGDRDRVLRIASYLCWLLLFAEVLGPLVAVLFAPEPGRADLWSPALLNFVIIVAGCSAFLAAFGSLPKRSAERRLFKTALLVAVVSGIWFAVAFAQELGSALHLAPVWIGAIAAGMLVPLSLVTAGFLFTAYLFGKASNGLASLVYRVFTGGYLKVVAAQAPSPTTASAWCAAQVVLGSPVTRGLYVVSSQSINAVAMPHEPFAAGTPKALLIVTTGFAQTLTEDEQCAAFVSLQVRDGLRPQAEPHPWLTADIQALQMLHEPFGLLDGMRKAQEAGVELPGDFVPLTMPHTCWLPLADTHVAKEDHLAARIRSLEELGGLAAV